MIHRDWLMIQLEEFARVLARVSGLKAEMRFDEASRLLRQHGRAILGADWELIELLTIDQMAERITRGEDSDRMLLTMEVLRAIGLLQYDAGEEGRNVLERAAAIGHSLDGRPGVNHERLHELLMEIEQTLETHAQK